MGSIRRARAEGPSWVSGLWWAFALAVLGSTPACTARRSTGSGPGPQASPRAQAPLPDCQGCNVVLVSIDTLRADHLGAYGYALPTSPHLDAFAARGAVFERAYSASFVTADAHMSIFTSLPPSVHGVRNAKPSERLAYRLPDGLATLPEWLRAAGYATAGFTSGGNVGAAYGFDRGMERYEVHTHTHTGVQRTLDFARASRAAGRPFFAFLHTYEAHDPYLPPADIAALFYEPYMGRVVRSRDELLAREPDLAFERQRAAYWDAVDGDDPLDVQQVVAAYDAEIRSVDEALAELWDALPALGRTLVIVTSDHGEQFGEHGDFLHNDLYDELLHVPLVLVHPDSDVGARVRVPVSTMDLAPTLLDLLGLPAAEQALGRSLRELDALPPRPVFAEKIGRGQAVMDGAHKLIWRPGKPFELYDLETDVYEERDLASRGPANALRATRQRLDAAHRDAREALVREGEPHDAHRQLDDTAVAQLRALGYGE